LGPSRVQKSETAAQDRRVSLGKIDCLWPQFRFPVHIGLIVLASCGRLQQRFVDVAGSAPIALDTKTGQYCNPATGHASSLPLCRDLYTGKVKYWMVVGSGANVAPMRSAALQSDASSGPA